MIDKLNSFFDSDMFIQRKFYAYIVLQSAILSTRMLMLSAPDDQSSSHLRVSLSYPVILDALNRVISICKQNDDLEKLRNLHNDLNARLYKMIIPSHNKHGTSQDERKAIGDLHTHLVDCISGKKYDQDNAKEILSKVSNLLALIEYQQMGPLCKQMIQLLFHLMKNDTSPTIPYVIPLINQITFAFLKFEPFVNDDTTSYFKSIEASIDQMTNFLNSNNK
jgi:hypothetical protein